MKSPSNIRLQGRAASGAPLKRVVRCVVNLPEVMGLVLLVVGERISSLLLALHRERLLKKSGCERLLPTLPEERGPIETQPEWKAETD